MENRLTLFRRQMSAFDGAADPRDAIEKGFYIQEPDHSATTRLVKRICLKADSRYLLTGGIGSGKTTQLFRIEQLLKDTDIYPHYVDVTEYENPEEIQAGLLRSIAGLELIALLRNAGVTLDVDVFKTINEYAYGKSVEVEGGGIPSSQQLLSLLSPPKTTVHRRGVLSPNRTNQSDRVSQSLMILVKEFEQKFKKKLFFLFDGLDRISNVENFIQAASDRLDDSGVGFLIVGPIRLLHSSFTDSIDSHFSHVEYRSAFDVQNDSEAYSFFEKIIICRSTKDFFQSDALKQIIISSGGVLRDLINLTQASIQEAYLSDAESVESQHVENAVNLLGRAKILGLNADENVALERIVNGNELSSITLPEEISLLANGRILEYKYPEHHFEVHPVLETLLSKRSLV
jgi:hypothetical protein